MPEAVGHNVWSKERGRGDSGYYSVVLRQNSVYISRLHRIKLGAGSGGSLGRREDSLHTAVLAQQLPTRTLSAV